MPDEDLMQVLGMAEEHRAFRAEPEGDDIAVVVFEPTQKAQHIAGKGERWARESGSEGQAAPVWQSYPVLLCRCGTSSACGVTTVWECRPCVRPASAAAGRQAAHARDEQGLGLHDGPTPDVDTRAVRAERGEHVRVERARTSIVRRAPSPPQRTRHQAHPAPGGVPSGRS